MGAEIVSQVVRDLVPLGLDNASSLLLAGSSAGGTGVMLNLDHIHGLVHHELGLKHVSVRGISDSGWFLDRAPYSPNGLSPVEAVRKGMELWRARMPKNCAAVHPHEPWRCYFGYRLYPTLSGKNFNAVTCELFIFITTLNAQNILRMKNLLYFTFFSFIHFSSAICISMALRRSANDSGQCRCASDKTTMGLYS